jgi:group I intron endonuclease
MAKSPLSKPGIYCIRNVVSGRVYVGSSVNIRSRWKSHRANLNNGRHPGKVMQASWDRHGPDAFEFSVLEFVENPHDLIAAEQRWIDALRAVDPELGFNVSPTAGNCLGVKHTEETRAKLASSRRGKPKSPEHRKAIGDAHRGRTIPEERRERVAEGVRRYFAENPEARERMRDVGRRNGAASAGRRMSEEQKRKLSEARLSDPRFAELSRANLAKVTPADRERGIANRQSRKGMANRKNRGMSFEQAEEIRRLKAEGWTFRRLSERFGRNVATLHRIVSGATYQRP